jgi:uncharacterized glyoxalase superfamily protein PhnB
MKIVTSLSFKGECRQAFDFYAQVLGGKVTAAFPFGEGPPDMPVDPQYKDWLRHCWLDVGDHQINLFGMGRHKLCRQSVAGAGPVSLNTEALQEAAQPGLDLLVGESGRSWGNAADAIAELNGRLVSSWDSTDTTRPIFFDDRHAAQALADHLEDPNGLITRLLTDPKRRQALDQRLEAAAAAVPFGRFMPLATAHFWGVRAS